MSQAPHMPEPEEPVRRDFGEEEDPLDFVDEEQPVDFDDFPGEKPDPEAS